MKAVVVIQARMGSTRLPGKVALDIGGKPMLLRVIERAARIEGIGGVVVATTEQPADEEVLELARRAGVAAFRGDEDRVLDRYYQAARHVRADVVVRVTADCPLLDPGICGAVLKAVVDDPEVEFAANTLERTYPRGLDVEAAPFRTLERLHRTVTDAHHWQHVFPYIYEHRDTFRVVNISDREDRSWMRWTVDTAEDLEFVREIYRRIPDGGSSWMDVVTLLDAHPELLGINGGIRQKSVREC